MPKTKYGHLLDDADMKRWHGNLFANSPVTAEVYLRTLGLYCEMVKTTPKAILDAAPSKKFRDDFLDFIRGMEKKDKAGSYIERFRKVLSSWIAHHGIDVKLRVSIKGKSETPTIQNERIPTVEELSKIIRMASPRARVSIGLMAFSGLRPQSLGDHLGTDGIRLGDFVEVKISESEGLVFQKIPTFLRIMAPISRSRHQYLTGVGEEEMRYIEDYLRRRIAAGEKLGPESPLLWFDPRGRRKNRFLRSSLIERDIREAIVKAGFAWRPYVLRSYCDTNLIIAESKGYISHPYLQFLMGHNGDIEARYSTNKKHLPPGIIEGMREAYKKSLRFLQTTRAQASEEELQAGFRRQILVAVGFKADELEKMDVDSLTDSDYQARVRERLLGKLANDGVKQRVIKAKEVEGYPC